MKQAKVIKTDVVCVRKRIARKHYTCFGCNGEIPIKKGDIYFNIPTKCTYEDKNVKFETIRICLRCQYFLKRKIDRKEELYKKNGLMIEKGSLQLCRLGKQDRNIWMSLVSDSRCNSKRNC